MLGLLGAGTPAIEPAFDPDGNGRIDQALAAHANPDHTLLTYSATGHSLSPTPDPAHDPPHLHPPPPPNRPHQLATGAPAHRLTDLTNWLRAHQPTA
ncbi:hypothetical protein NBRGN_098_01720 [Nocardia brasiliensis NBRC 14402]|nr:hypothetical protein NBRGN_098_01720 [Nocardia brasiliensis NBRC 14402]